MLGDHSAFTDLLDNLVVSRDGLPLGRVADVRAEWRDGRLVLTELLLGPQVLAGRVASLLVPLARLVFRDRFEHAIPMSEVVEIGPTVRLRGGASQYRPMRAGDRWIAEHVLRFISWFRY